MMEEERKCCSKEHREAENNEELQQFGSDVGGRTEEMVNVLVHNWLLRHQHYCSHAALCINVYFRLITEPRQPALSKQ